jgi:TonB family protein
MNRTQKKCLIASLATHGFLLLMLIVGPAFVTSKPPPSNDLPLLDVIPATLVDEMISSGGTPAPVTPAASTVKPAAPVAAPAAQPEPVQPAPPKPEVKTAKPPATQPEEEQAPEPEPVKKQVNKTPDPDDIPVNPPKTTKKPIMVDIKKAVTRKVGGKSRGADEKAREEAEEKAAKAEARAYATAQANRRAALTGAISDIRGGLSGTVKIEGIGDGVGGGMGGGAAAANYAQAIRSIYDKAWYDPPKEVTDNSLNVEVKINIARSGRIVSARVSGPSGNSTLDRSVRRALDRVQSVPAFPAGATDLDRTYTIIFNLKSKRPLG